MAKNISIQSRCLLDDSMHFYLNFTVYATPYLAHGTHLRTVEELRQHHGVEELRQYHYHSLIDIQRQDE